MKNKVAIGIDNGVSGSIGVVSSQSAYFYHTPTFTEQNYTKKKANISRIDTKKLREILDPFKDNCMVLLERPMVHPGRFKATTSALRSLEATIIVLETLLMPYAYIDSKEWQKKLLPKGTKGGTELKKASLDIASRLFPQFKGEFIKQKDGDGMLIAEYCKRNLL